MVEAGSARVRITPPLGSLLAGNAGLRREATGIVDHLSANALVVSSDETTVALASCDVIGIEPASTARIRDAVAETTGIPPTNVVLVATHTHTGPQTGRFFREPDEEYVEYFEKQVVSAIRLAADDTAPSTLTHAREEEPRFAHNRRLVLNDGRLILPTQEFDERELAYAEGETDPTLDLLTVQDDDGAVSAVVVAYTTHTDTVTGYEISADFPGWIARTIRRVYGDDVDVLYVPGAAGNVSTYDPAKRHESREHYLDPNGAARAGRIGRYLAGASIRGIERTRDDGDAAPRLDAALDSVPLETRRPSREDLETARAVLEGDDDRSLRDRVLARSTLSFAEYQDENPTVEVPVQTVRLGETLLVALPGEPFAEFGLRIREALDLPTMIAGYANASVGYLPTEQAHENGGYETTAGWTSRFHPGAGERLTEGAIDLATRLDR